MVGVDLLAEAEDMRYRDQLQQQEVDLEFMGKDLVEDLQQKVALVDTAEAEAQEQQEVMEFLDLLEAQEETERTHTLLGD
jgi:hypothetical protein